MSESQVVTGDKKPHPELDEPSQGSESRRRRSKWRRIGSAALQIGIVLAVLWGIGQWQARRLLPASSQAPGFVLESLDGRRISLDDAKGRKQVLYFFAPWCSVCELSSRNIRALRQARSEAEVAVYAVGVAYESAADLQAFAREHELNVPVLKGTEQLRQAYKVDSFPTIYILDEQGAVQSRLVGYTTELGLRLRAL